METVEQNHAVGRKRPEDPYRVRMNVSLAKEIVDALQRESERTDVPMSRIIERALRVQLGIEKADEEGG